jgi:hypothetical protein
MTSPPFFYCSELSRGFAEKTYGTASVGDVWLMIEYPFWWASKAFQESHLSPSVKSHLNRFLKSIPRSRLLFIKRDRLGRSGELSVFVVRCREREPSTVQLRIKDYEELRGIDLVGIARASGVEALAAGVVRERPLYLICTHGRRDKCCAKFGYPLYKSLSAQDTSVWQSSHVGGDRFAANLVCFPHGLFYAHMTLEMSRHVIAEYEARRVVLDKYRGRACYSYPAQAAEYFIRTEGRIAGLDALRQLDCRPAGEKSWRVRFAAGEDDAPETVHEARVRNVMSVFQSYNTCHAAEAKSVPQYLLDEYSVTSMGILPTASDPS